MTNHPVFIVEIAGPAGAGKSTIANALCLKNPKIQIGEFPDIHNSKKLEGIFWNTLKFLPTIRSFYFHSKTRPLTLQEIAHMAILQEWHQELKASSGGPKIILLDQGPVYILAELIRFGPPQFRQIACKWWDEQCEKWANLLDLVICIDTADEVLIERIRTRSKTHGIKQNSDEWAHQFLAQYRNAQGEALKSMKEQKKAPLIVEIDTPQIPLNETIEKIFPYLEKKL